MDDKDSVKPNQIADSITLRHRFARDPGGRLYIYRKGVYHPDGDSSVRQLVKAFLKSRGLATQWSSRKAEEVVKYIEVDAPLLWERPPMDRINVLNGLLDVNTAKLSPHSPDFLSPIQLPVKFDPDARCETWDWFVPDVFPGDSSALAWEIPAWLMTPDMAIQKAILLNGEGRNGKSTYLRALLAFLGLNNVCAISLHHLETDRFSVARLVGKLANICPDLPSEDLASTSIFKSITGGDVLLAERKYEASFELSPFARLIFSANILPKGRDASPAFFRRWIVIPFERVFKDGDPGTIRGDELDAMLADPTEMSGLLNRAIKVLPLIRANGLTEGASVRRAIEEFRQTTDPFAVWLDLNTQSGPKEIYPVDKLWQDYNLDCAAKGRPVITKTALGLAIGRFRPSVKKQQRKVNDRLSWCYLGIGATKSLVLVTTTQESSRGSLGFS
jgi:P4 family phage/plasmid primase-like protien